MIDVDHEAVLRVKARELHHPARGGDYVGALIGEKIDANNAKTELLLRN